MNWGALNLNQIQEEKKKLYYIRFKERKGKKPEGRNWE